MKNFAAVILFSMTLVNCGSKDNDGTSAASATKLDHTKVINYADIYVPEKYDPKANMVMMFGASWCAACPQVKDQMVQLASESQGFEDYAVIYVDADLHRDVLTMQGVTTVPAVHYLSQGVIVERMDNGGPLSRLRDHIRQARLNRRR